MKREPGDRLRVLHLARRFWPVHGGTERYVGEIARRLRAYDVESRVLTLRGDVMDRRVQLPATAEYDDARIYRVPFLGHPKKPVPLRVPVSLFRWADVVHTHDPRVFFETALALKPFLGYRLVYSTHGFILHTGEWDAVKRVAIPLYYRPAFRLAVDEIFCVSRLDESFFRGLRLPNVRLIPNGVDTGKFESVQREPEPGRLLTFGRIASNKGLDLLLRAMAAAAHPQLHLHVVGTGQPELMRELRELAERLRVDSRVSWHGAVEETALLEHLRRARLCVFPSTYEGFGLTLLEAMSAGAACLANRTPAFAEFAEAGRDAEFVDFTDAEVAGRAIDRLLDADPCALDRLGTRARETARQYDWSHHVASLVQAYRRVVG